jgi:hypothetical protein
MGSGGAPEGVLAAAALRCIGGQMQGRLLFRNDDEKGRARRLGITDLNRKYAMMDLAKGDVMFAATGVTDGAHAQGRAARRRARRPPIPWSCAPSPAPSGWSRRSTTGRSRRACRITPQRRSSGANDAKPTPISASASRCAAAFWLERPGDERLGLAIAQRCQVPEIIGRMLAARGQSLEGAPGFLQPRLRDLLTDPVRAQGHGPGGERLADAVARRERIADLRRL